MSGPADGPWEARVGSRFEDWRAQARAYLEREIAPGRLSWRARDDAQEMLLPAADATAAADDGGPGPARARRSVPAAFLAQARLVGAHRDDDRWALLYRVLWRLTHGEPELLQVAIDPDTQRFQSMHRSVHRDMHKMKAFVRFRELKLAEGGSWFVAWHEPDHRIVPLIAPFFIERFNGMRWSIQTPDESVHWAGAPSPGQTPAHPVFTAGCARTEALAEVDDPKENLWLTYYASIFNPARIKTRAMRKEMPVRYWKNLPESALIGGLIRAAPARLQEFYRDQAPSAESWLPPPTSSTTLAPADALEQLRTAARGCRACGICEAATQTVFGEGPADAQVVLVGEQPGDQEDLAGRPFIGPAGKLLDRALVEAGVERHALYLTNAVKHFKWTPHGTGPTKMRLHQRPASGEIAACKAWLNAELAVVKPRRLVCLGTSAAQAVLGKAITLRDVRGRRHETGACAETWVTTHPSAILRTADAGEREREYGRFVAELREACGI